LNLNCENNFDKSVLFLVGDGVLKIGSAFFGPRKYKEIVGSEFLMKENTGK